MRAKIKDRPIDIPLAEGVVLEGGAIFVRLKTIDELESFWISNKDKLPYCAAWSGRGSASDNELMVLDEYEWIFGPTKAAVVKTAMRWDALGITCRQYDDRNEAEIDEAEIDEAEIDFNATRVDYTGEFGAGWILENEPYWHVDPLQFPADIGWVNLPTETATLLFQEMIFNEGLLGSEQGINWWVTFYDRGTMDENIKNCRTDGYGDE